MSAYGLKISYKPRYSFQKNEGFNYTLPFAQLFVKTSVCKESRAYQRKDNSTIIGQNMF